MAIEIELPNGDIAEFPDGTSDEIITAALQRESGLVSPGNIDPNSRPVVKNADGSISTVKTAGFTLDDGRVVNIPTVSDDGRMMSDEEAFETFKRTGKHLGIFNSVESANAAAEQLHLDQEKQYVPAGREGTTLSDIGRGLGLGTRNVLEGVGSLGEIVTGPINAVNSLFGGDPNYLEGNAGRALSNLVGLPKPETESERLYADIQKGAAGALGGYGVGSALQASRAAAPIAQALKTAPFMQGASGAGAGYAAGQARESGVSPGMQVAAGLAGGFAAPAGASVGALGWRGLGGTRTALDAFTPGGRNRIAGQTLNRLATNKDAAKAAMAADAGEIVPGSMPTLAQASGDTGLAILEKGLESSGPQSGGLQQRYIDQRASQQAALRESLESTAPFGGNLETGDVGTRVRTAFDANYASAKGRTRAAYEAIDPEGTASFNIEPLADRFQSVIGGGRYQRVPGEVGTFMRQIADDLKEGRNVSYRDLQDIRTALTDMSESAARSGDAATARIAGGMKRELDGYLEISSQNIDLQGSAPYAQPGSKAYREANSFARDAIGNDPYYEDLSYLAKEGISRDSALQIIGEEGVRELNKLAPGLVRKTGKVQADTIGDSLSGGIAYGYGDPTMPTDGQALLDSLIDRLGPGRGRMRADTARLRDEYLQGTAAPHTGFTPQQAELFRIAKEARTIQGKRFESGANTAMSRRGGSLEGTQVPTSEVPAHYFRAGEKGGESMRAFNLAAGNNPDARQAMADYAISQGIRKSTRKSGGIDLDALTRWANSHKPALDQLGLGKIASMPKVRADINRANDATRKAGVKGSPTAQNLATQAVIDRVVGDYRISADTGAVGSLASSVVTGIPRMLTQKTGNFLFGPANEAVNNILTGAALDPALALRLMENAAYVPRMNIADILKNNAKAYGAATLRTPGLIQAMEQGQ